MIQGGDPTGTGKGGQSIYGNYFQDEFKDHLVHNKRGIGTWLSGVVLVQS